MVETKMTVVKSARHRNGISGEPFTVAIVELVEDGVKRNMVVVHFNGTKGEETGNKTCTAAFDINHLVSHEIESFGPNCWRGDNFTSLMEKETTALKGE